MSLSEKSDFFPYHTQCINFFTKFLVAIKALIFNFSNPLSLEVEALWKNEYPVLIQCPHMATVLKDPTDHSLLPCRTVSSTHFYIFLWFSSFYPISTLTTLFSFYSPIVSLATGFLSKHRRFNVDLSDCSMIKRRRHWQPTPVLLPGESHGQRTMVGCSPWVH